MMTANCGFGMMWLGGLTWLFGLVLLVSLIGLTSTAVARLRRPDAGAGPRA